MGEQENGASPLFTSITRKTLLILINFVMMGVIGVISWKFVASYMPAPVEGVVNEIGVVGSAIAFIGWFSFLTNLGFGAAHVKRVSEGKDLGKCIGTFFTVQVISVLVLIITVVGALLFWKHGLGRGFESTKWEYTIYLLLGYYAANNLSTVGLQTFVAKVQIAKNQLVVFVAALVQLIVTIVVVMNTNDLYIYATTFVVGAFVNLFISYFYLLKFPIKPPSWRIFKSYFSFSIPMFVVSALAPLTMNIDKLMVQLFWASSSVGIYIGGQKFSTYLIQISAGLSMILFPTFSNLKSKEKTGEIKDLVNSSERLIAMVMGPMCAIVFALSLPIVTLLGTDSYAASYLILQPLAIWSFIRSMNAPYRTLLMGTGKPWVLAIASVVGIVLVIGLNILFIPKDIQALGITLLGMGPKGAAYATMISAFGTMLTYRIFTYKYHKVFLNLAITRFMIASVLTGAAVYGINHLFPAENILVMAGYAIAGMIIYTILLFVMRALKKEDMDLFKSVIHPGAMVKYVKDDLMNRQKDEH